jgi:hypothetical protein
MFLTPWFAIAGLVAAAGPIAIHLLNRRRYRVVEWAAMDFLRQAIRRSRRILQLRDVLLLILRTACVLLFGLAMARPYWGGASSTVDPDQPIHVVLLVDNSLSMSYDQLGRTLLEKAKMTAGEYIKRLPPGNRVSVLPVCGSREFSLGAYSTKEDALEALDAIEAVDRQASAGAAVDLALEACRRVPSPSSKQVVFLSDQQWCNWPPQSLDAQLKQLPCPVQVVQVLPDAAENAWIADFRLQDGMADASSPAVFLATIRYEGSSPRHDVQVTLVVDGVTIATQTVELQPGQEREVRFPPYQFDVSSEPGRPAFVTAEVAIPHDRLPADDQRSLVVPVVSAMPVVFVDQYGSDEDPRRNRFGETFRLRRLLAPMTSRNDQDRQLIQIRHVKIDQLSRDLLADARLVVVAGINSPENSVPLLREYVEQGGALLIAAGGEFDPAAWTDAAWKDGLGILPAPLKPTPVGQLPTATTGPLQPFQLDFASLVHDYFLLAQSPREELEDLYRLPYFFKAVEADLSDDVLGRMMRTAAQKIEKDQAAVADLDRRLEELAQKEVRGPLTESQRQERERLQQARADTQPQWLLWTADQRSEKSSRGPVELAEKTRPRVLGSYTNRIPFLIQREIGRGQVLFVSTGVYRDWNTLTTTNAVLVFDRIFRDLVQRSLPQRNLTSTGQIVLPVAPELHRARFTLTTPSGREEPLPVDALGADRYGITLKNLPQRGLYQIAAHGTKQTPQAGPDAKVWQVALAVNGPVEESDLRVLGEKDLQERMGQAAYRWVADGQPITLTAAQVQGQDLWKWAMLAVLGCLLVELAIVAWPSLVGGRAP